MKCFRSFLGPFPRGSDHCRTKTKPFAVCLFHAYSESRQCTARLLELPLAEYQGPLGSDSCCQAANIQEDLQNRPESPELEVGRPLCSLILAANSFMLKYLYKNTSGTHRAPTYCPTTKRCAGSATILHYARLPACLPAALFFPYKNSQL